MIPTAIATAPVGTLFGFVKSFPILVAIRLLCGLLNGSEADVSANAIADTLTAGKQRSQRRTWQRSPTLTVKLLPFH